MSAINYVLMENELEIDDMEDQFDDEPGSVTFRKKIKALERQKNQCIITHKAAWKIKWDVWIILVLLFVAVTLPVRIAFYETDSTLWKIINYTVDSSFAIDVVLTFFTAVPDPENNDLITDKSTIAKMYLKSWFLIDVISIVPIDKLMTEGSNKLN